MIILLTKIISPQNEVALSFHRMRGLYFLAVIFAATICNDDSDILNNNS